MLITTIRQQVRNISNLATRTKITIKIGLRDSAGTSQQRLSYGHTNSYEGACIRAYELILRNRLVRSKIYAEKHIVLRPSLMY